MSQVFHEIEKKIITILKSQSTLTPEKLGELTQLSPDQVRRGIEWLRLKELAIVNETQNINFSLGKNGLHAFRSGLPERKLVDLVKENSMKISDLQKQLGSVFGPAMGLAKKNNWIESAGNEILLKTYPSSIPGEKSLKQIGESFVSKENLDQQDLQSLLKRPDFIVENLIKTKEISLTKNAQALEISESDSGAIDVEANVPEVFVAKTHPLKDTIDEIREIFVTLGFSEVFGNLTQPSFWNFDALFTPQDHPARELQDTFYLDGISSKKIGTPDQIRKVSESHKKGWRYYWDINEARKMVLRTHTTCVTIKHLAENKPDEARVFSLGRVFRNEKVSYKHLVEFNQIEGVVVGSNANLRNLMGIQREFYRRIGITKIKFWPTFFPYTEPSLQTMVYNERLGKWVELFGMGIFRPEVTKPLGITKPVLAWGGGIERIAMLKYGLDDVREFYNNNLNWLRSASKCQ
ncbi:MAG: phenylalanine--tRNA ligase subunit alpha [Nitrosopumilaceae archaeon]|uniref:Phenylalanine--tRNA ligase subunit alpha n=2 Tax=Candidatus Nitrosomaritimum aestuariumsis TaxID=3342354 RepID=A0AC60WAD4_9ARCH|nr:phenylalanine--tRNA ligase subunit alpha [Nitrosopumilaceae archaeon]MBA4460197.1 phenylalanine--tRNA ligase subunit alpha [Nitrosopumilaceae archaeon]MBA4461104.1 phenylalanine--tRNA ligase subunit alpha [Nitrosopumilaceae archaeon]MBA4464041.1 phenylalanine--tRNA ligase subunit alpha [Nitrosopumilaceae archaeon]NCF22139.1 phenylalanine--tRNA ligase subunit alpha [Nitrosopumilaceae archaeon]